MKRRLAGVCTLVCMMIGLCSATGKVYAYEYSFSSNDDSDKFGKSGSVDMDYQINTVPENVRNNKDVTYYPPVYGMFSGEFPTEQTSLYHTMPEMEMSVQVSDDDGSLSTSTGYVSGGNTSTVTLPEANGMLTSTSTMESLQTLPWEYADGSIGTLSIPSINLKIKVYEGETNENMRKGAGHFAYTSAWDGNIGLAGHNRGTYGYFEGIKNLKKGDRITYTTRYGTRDYEVILNRKISNTDTSYLGWTDDNTITLITCVANLPEYRLCIQAREVK